MNPIHSLIYSQNFSKSLTYELLNNTEEGLSLNSFAYVLEKLKENDNKDRIEELEEEVNNLTGDVEELEKNSSDKDDLEDKVSELNDKVNELESEKEGLVELVKEMENKLQELEKPL